MANKRSIYDDGSIHSSNSRIYRAYSKAKNTGGYIGRSAIGTGKELYSDLLGANAPEVVQSHKQAAVLGLLGGPVASYLLKESYNKLKPTLSNALNKIKNIRGSGGGYGDMGGDLITDDSIDPDISDESLITPSTKSYSKRTKKVSPKVEEIEETYVGRDGSRRKRRVTVRNSGKRQNVTYRELVNTDSKGISRSSHSKKSRTSGSESMVKASMMVSPSSVDTDLGSKVSGSNDLTKKDYAFITYLARSITAKLEKNEKLKRTGSEKIAYGIKKIAMQTLPSIPVLKTSKYYSRLPNPARVGVMNSINSTLGMIYAAIRGTTSETNRLLYAIANINKLGFGITARIPRPIDVESLTEFAGGLSRRIISKPFRMVAGMFGGGFSPSISTPEGYRKDIPGQKHKRSAGEAWGSVKGGMKKAFNPFGWGMLTIPLILSLLSGGPGIIGAAGGLASSGFSKGMGAATNFLFNKDTLKILLPVLAATMGINALSSIGTGKKTSSSPWKMTKSLFGFGEKQNESQNINAEGKTGILQTRGMKLRMALSNDTIAIVQSINSIHAYLEAAFGPLDKIEKKEYWKIRERRDSEMLKYTIKENKEAGKDRKWNMIERMMNLSASSKILSLLAGLAGLGAAAFKWGDVGNLWDRTKEFASDPGKDIGGSIKSGGGLSLTRLLGKSLSKNIKMTDIGKGFSSSLGNVWKKMRGKDVAKGAVTGGVKSSLKKGALKSIGPVGAIVDMGMGIESGESFGESAIRTGTSIAGGSIIGGIAGAATGGALAVPGFILGSMLGDFLGKFLGATFGETLDTAVEKQLGVDPTAMFQDAIYTAKKMYFNISERVKAVVTVLGNTFSLLFDGIFTTLRQALLGFSKVIKMTVTPAAKILDWVGIDAAGDVLEKMDKGIAFLGERSFSDVGESYNKMMEDSKTAGEDYKKRRSEFFESNIGLMSESEIDRILTEESDKLPQNTISALQAEQKNRIDKYNQKINDTPIDTSAINPYKMEMQSTFDRGEAQNSRRNAFQRSNSITSSKSSRRGIGSGDTGGVNIGEMEGGAGFKFSDFPGVELTPLQKYAMVKEGFSPTPYWDEKGRSIGFGHFLKPDEQHWTYITKEDALRLFLSDFEEHQNKFIQQFPPGVWERISPGRQAALIDMAYTMGPYWMKEWGALEKYIIPGDWNGFYNSIKNSKYITQTKTRGQQVAEAIKTGVFNIPSMTISEAASKTMNATVAAAAGVKNWGTEAATSSYNWAKENAPGAWDATKNMATSAMNWVKPHSENAIETMKVTGNQFSADMAEFSNTVSKYAHEKTIGEISEDTKKAVAAKAVELREKYGSSIDEIIEKSELDDKVKAMYSSETTQKAMAGVSKTVSESMGAMGEGLRNIGSQITGMTSNVVNQVSNVVSSGMGNSELTGKGIEPELMNILLGDI